MTATNGSNGKGKGRPQRTHRARQRAAGTWKPKFLAAFADVGTVVEACEVAGVGRRTAYQARQADEDFALAWADVEEAVTEGLEREAKRRALDGSDRLLEFLLKARRPDRYRENVKVEHSGEVKATPAPIDAPQRSVSAAQLLADVTSNGNGHR